MFSDVLVALRRARSVDPVLVVTADTARQQIAGRPRRGGARGRRRGSQSRRRGRGARRAARAGAERALLVPGDCPLLDPAELDDLIAHPVDGRSALIVPDRHGTGTNALLLTPPDALAPAFGPGSRERHVANARRRGHDRRGLAVPSLALDVDTPEDLEALQATLAPSARRRRAHARDAATADAQPELKHHEMLTAVALTGCRRSSRATTSRR